ncbi:phosphoglycerate dehydrogenase [Methanobrevibacter millerae]|uniref:D-3-phosphoglycerate dehydrogenase n=1 Tax=Methanobrevibacter millerae TaxID=230361 RepID=A0A1G5VY34_9EURY|nr:phosphoglycerate dehydrogenase [Methanobrevibacter millerae]SDA50638.1 D-3-phosphoglycerate dehydrogenase [Methanobrevibacter millerae]
MKVLVADAINEKGIENLKEVAEVTVDTSITPEELINTIHEYHGIIVRSRTKVTKEVIDKADNLKIIARAGVGVDNIDLDAATEKGIMVVNSPESTSITVAEHTMGLLLSMARKLSIADKSVKEGNWEKKKFMGVELRNKTLGVIGMGRIGSQVVNRCKSFEMDAVAYDPYLPEEVATQMGVELTDLETVLKKADFITIHVPLTPETKHLISYDEFETMKDTVFITNCARGGIIDEEALYDALKNDKIGGAALDVYEEEPPAKDSKLFELDNIVLTPHIAASTKEAQRDAAIIVADEIIDLFKGGTPKNVLNMPRIDNNTYQELSPYFEICEKLGSFISQAVNGKIKDLEIVYSGELAKIDNLEILTRTVIQGAVNPFLSSPVNAVNAALVAKDRGINITEGRKTNAKGYESLIRVKAKSNDDEFSAEGTTLHEARILKVNDYWVDVIPEGHMFIAKYEDVPGSIGAIGTKLGEYGVNIGIMQVGRDEKGGRAIMILTLDKEIPTDVIKEIQALNNVYEAIGLEL